MADDDLTHKLEGLFEGLAGFLHRFLRTFWFILRHPARAAAALAEGGDARNVPPFTFMVASYVALVLGLAITSEVLDIAVESGTTAVAEVVDIVMKWLPAQDYSAGKMLLLALPVVLVLLAAAYALHRAAGMDRRPALALIAYSAGYTWLVAVAFMMAFIALTFTPRHPPALYLALRIVAVLVFLALLWAILVPLTGYVASSVLKAASAPTRGRRAFQVMAVLAITIAAHWVNFLLIERAAATGAAGPLAVDVHVRSVRVGSDVDPGSHTYFGFESVGEPRFAQAAQPAVRHQSQPVALTLAIRNRSARTLYFFREAPPPVRDGFTLALARRSARPANGGDARAPLDSVDLMRLTVLQWADSAAPVMVLRPGDVKWANLFGVTEAMQTPLDAGGLAFTLEARSADGAVAASPWQWLAGKK